jgi:DNA-directed RNA polymerase specialized sigma24 family protein
MNEQFTRGDHNITQLLIKWGSGDKAALDELIPLVYDELRKLAASYLRRKSGSNTLQATALVHEAYVRLADQSSISMEHRAQFFGWLRRSCATFWLTTRVSASRQNAAAINCICLWQRSIALAANLR